jgi:hypothetical protein
MRWLLGADRREKVGMKWWWWVFLIVSGCVDKRQSPTARGRKKERKPGLSKTRKALKVHNRTDNFLFYSFQQSFIHPTSTTPNIPSSLSHFPKIVSIILVFIKD